MDKTGKKHQPGIEAVLAALDVDVTGVATIDDIAGSNLEKAARRLLPEVNSIIVLGMEIYPEFLDLSIPEKTTGATRMNDMLEKHKDFLRGRLTSAAYKFAQVCRAQHLAALPLSGEDSSSDEHSPERLISFKDAAEAAGLGLVGMSGLLITQDYGPRLLLNLCLAEAGLTSTAREDSKACRYCNICVFKCPAKAIGYPDRKQGEKCLINWSTCSQYVATAGGCSECMRVCPVASPKYNK